MIAYPNAKVNLGLNIIRKRADGYHDIESGFIPIGWRDVLEIIEDSDRPAGQVIFTTSGIPVPSDGNPNLCERAYHLLTAEHGLPAVRIHLHKIIPIGAGLGGGSSDAAFTLILLNELFELGETEERLEHLAAQIGSDCPFFIRNRPQFVTGRGELMEPIGLQLEGLHMLLLYPRIHIGTAEAYSGVRPHVQNTPLREVLSEPLDKWRYLLHNDFEDSLFPRYPMLEELKGALYRAGAAYASMTGSGSTMYGIFREKADVRIPEGMDHLWTTL